MDKDYVRARADTACGRIRSVLEGTQRISNLNQISIRLALNDLKELKEELMRTIEEDEE